MSAGTTVYSNAFAEAVEEARSAVSFALVYSGENRPVKYAQWVLSRLETRPGVDDNPRYQCFRLLRQFEDNHGAPALLRVIAQALELSHK